MTFRCCGLLLASLLVLSSCDDFEGFDRAREEFHYTHDLAPGVRLELDNTNGAVEIAGWDRNSIDISGEKYAPSKEELQRVKVDIQIDGNNVSIHTRRPTGFSMGNYGAHYVLHVPSSITVGLAQTTNGSVSAEDLHGPGRIQSTNGRIHLARITGNYDVQTTNGSIQFEDLQGSERAHTTNGTIGGRVAKGSVSAETTNGSIDLTLASPPPSETVRLETTNGAIRLTLAEFHENPIRASTTHGSITLQLPGQVDAVLHADTSLASIENQLPTTNVEDQSKHHLSARLGQGGPLIDLSTSTGSIRVLKY